jgi:hypothetical protein
MDAEERGRRVSAALECYAIIARRAPGSPVSDAAEQAVLYTLSDRRDAGRAEDLLRDAMHDGHRTVLRAARSRQAVERELMRLSASGIDTAAARAAVGANVPEQAALARELLELLKHRAYVIGSPAPQVLAGMLVGETEAETAAAVDVSRSTVTRTRRALRKTAMDAGYLPAAA